MTRSELSAGARSLLRIASERGNETAVSGNYTLVRMLDSLFRLHDEAARNALPKDIAQSEPEHMLGLAAVVSHDIYRSQNRTDPDAVPTGRPVLTRFDAHVHQAFAQTLADAVWPDREERDPPTGPTVDECLRKLAAQNRRALAEAFVENYVGNILQHFFVAAEVRRQRPDLPDETETELRSVDAKVVARRVMTLLPGESPTPAEISSVLAFVIAEEPDR